MNMMIILASVTASLVLFLILLLVLLMQRTRQLRHAEQLNIQLQTSLNERENFFQQQLAEASDSKSQQQQQFAQLAQQVLNRNSSQLHQQQESAMRLVLEPFQQQVSQFSQQISQLHNYQTASQASLQTELKTLQQLNIKITEEAHQLSQALKGNKKMTGNWGELQLERCLEAAGLTADIHYFRERSFRDKTQQLKRPDVVIQLPNNKHIIVDSKMSLVDFSAAIAADDSRSEQQALNKHNQALKRHIDGLASKEYTALPELNSPEFVIMFVPLEPALTEALKTDPQLFEYGLAKNIVLASPITLIPLLKTIAQQWLAERSHSEAMALADKADDVYQQLHTLAERLQKLGRTLNTGAQQYNDVITAMSGRQGLYHKTERFSSLAKNTRELPTLMDIDTDCSDDKLNTLLKEQAQPTSLAD